MKIKETIVVEGRDDTTAVRAAVDCLTVETHGYGIRPRTWELIDRAYNTTGIIIFTDPDHAGNQIRKRVKDRYPDAKEAFLPRDLAEKDGDIGIENASPESIKVALSKARCCQIGGEGSLTMSDLDRWGLCGGDGASQKRERLSKILGIGHANGKTLLRRLNAFGITGREIESAIEKIDKGL